MNLLKLAIVFFSFLGLISPSSAQENLTPDEVVAKVDNVRNPELDYTSVAKVTSYKPNRPNRAAVYEVLVKGRDRTIVKTLEPQVERGRSLLMRDQDFWAFFPDVEKPLRISFQERLIGDVANGDIARTNFSGDYSAKLLREEDADGKKYYVLELLSKRDGTTYGKVILWVEQGSFWPLKAEFYAISGRFLKTCTYENYKMLAGQMRPSKLVLRDVVVQGQYSVIEYDEMRLGEIPDKYFSKDYLKKIVD